MEQLELSDVIAEAKIQKDHKFLCTVYLKGIRKSDALNAPKVMGIVHTGKDDFTIKEEAYMLYMGRIVQPGIMIVRKAN